MPMWLTRIRAIAGCGAAIVAIAGGCGGSRERVLTLSGSLLGREGEVVRQQLERFRTAHPGIAVELRATPDNADQRHQLYVQWLNARVGEPDVLQLDVVWTAEFAAAGWIAALDRFGPPVGELFAAAVAANRWNGALYALPWFVDVGMLYWRTDLMPAPPDTLSQLLAAAQDARTRHGLPFGLVWQGARYEGLVTVFVEYLGAFGGAILDGDGRVMVDAGPAVEALTFMRDAIHGDAVVPAAVLTWQEEQTRFAFQNGQAAFMRNWPYAFALMGDRESAVAGRFAVAPIPGQAGRGPTAALGGSTLAVNAFSDQPDDAYRLIAFLLQPAQMVERAEVAGQFPPRPALYDDPALAAVLKIPAAEARRIIEAAVPRPASPVYSQLSSILQLSLHRALTRQQEPQEALRDAATEMRALLERLQLGVS
jgi:ABC-type glycerol-3-phosphate transport system substrate-binding protein